MNIYYRELNIEEINKINEIDRTELIEHLYYHENGQLVLKPERYDMTGFPPGEKEEIIERQKVILSDRGCVIGAFFEDTLVGIASHDSAFRGALKDTLKMDILFVSYTYRKSGVASALMEQIANHAKGNGASKLYISATPSENTVRFYMNRGARLAGPDEMDAHLYELEPEDIHLIYEI